MGRFAANIFGDDEANRVDEPEAEGDTPAEAESAGDGDETPAEDGSQELGEDIREIQARLIRSDKEKAKAAQDAAFIKSKLAELQPYIDIGINVAKSPNAYSYYQKLMAGETPTAAEEKAGKAAAQKAAMTPQQLLQHIDKRIGEAVQNALNVNNMSQRAFNKLDSRARKEIENFADLEDHPEYLGWVSSINGAIDNGTLQVPEGEDKNFFALKRAREAMVASNPEFLKAVKAAGVADGKESAAKKMKAGMANGSSRGSTGGASGSGDQKLTQAEKDRLSMTQAWLRGGGGRRLPSAARR